MKYGVKIGCVAVAVLASIAAGMRLGRAGAGSAVSVPSVPARRGAPPGTGPVAQQAPASSFAKGSASTQALPDDYRVLLTRSIFAGRVPGIKAAPSSAGSALALRGVMQCGAGMVAFVEDTSSGRARLVHVGDAVGDGKIAAIELGHVEFARGERSARIAVGQTFSGEVSRVVVIKPASAAAPYDPGAKSKTAVKKVPRAESDPSSVNSKKSKQ